MNGSADSAVASNAADRLRLIGARGAAAAAQVSVLRAGLTASSIDERIAAAWAFTQLGRAARPAADDLTRALDDADHVVRGLAALALRDAGPLPDASIDALAAHLTDADDGVRMASGWAIASQGPRAMRVFPALLAAGLADPQHPHVQRAIADAFGAIGPAASEALPVLEALARGPRVRWNATAAMRRVRGRPPGAR